MSAPDTREALSRGTLDALVFPYGSIMPYVLVPSLKTATGGLNLGSFVATYIISRSKYDSLPPEVQKALNEAGKSATRQACEAFDEMVEGVKQKITGAKVTFVTLPGADLTRISEILQTDGEEWAADLDSRGRPGSEVLSAFVSALD